MNVVLLLLVTVPSLFALPDRSAAEQNILDHAKDYLFFPETPATPQLNPEKSLVLNEYAACDPSRLEWYTDLSDFKRAMDLCGFDYVRLRFDRSYHDSGLTANATYYFTLKDAEVLFDSLTAMVTVDKGKSFNLKITDQEISIPNTLLASELVDRMILKKHRSQAFASYAETIHGSFLSRLVLKRTGVEPHYCFTFRIAGAAYSIVGDAGNAGQDAELVKHEEKLDILENRTTAGAYAIGFNNAVLAQKLAAGVKDPFLEKRPEYKPVRITDYSMKFDGRSQVREDRLHLFEINVTAKSPEGLRQIGIRFNGVWDIVKLDGSTLASHSIRVPYSEECVEFEALAMDIYGDRVTEKNPRYIRDLEDNGIHPFDSLWQVCGKEGDGRKADSGYLKRMEQRKRANKAKSIAKNVIKLLPLFFF